MRWGTRGHIFSKYTISLKVSYFPVAFNHTSILTSGRSTRTNHLVLIVHKPSPPLHPSQVHLTSILRMLVSDFSFFSASVHLLRTGSAKSEESE